MPTIQGFGIEDFIKYKPPANTIAISFASKLDRQYDHQLYAKLPDTYTRYLNHLVILADDIPINKPNPEYQLFTSKDAQNVINFVNKYLNSDIVVHCNAGISRTGTLVRFLANHYNYHIMGQQNFVTNPLINNLLQQVYKKNQQKYI